MIVVAPTARRTPSRITSPKSNRRGEKSIGPARPANASETAPLPNWEQVAREIAQVEPEFIYNPAFADPMADATIMSTPDDETAVEASWKPGPGMPPYLARLCERKLLTPSEEHDLFRRMNYAKYRIAGLRHQLDLRKPNPELLEQILRYATVAHADRDRIVQANLRLVVSIAKKFADLKNSFDELLSEGIATLMRAAEKFDFDRGFRFSTYATLAIRRSLSRMVSQAQRDRTRFVPTETTLLEGTSVEEGEGALNEQRWEELRSTLGKLLHKLDPRERAIIRCRFGLDKTRQVRTLQSLAKDFGVCKERVRQLEMRAMNKLRTMAEQTTLSQGETSSA